MKVYCYNAIRSIKELATMRQLITKRYPSYELVGFDETSEIYYESYLELHSGLAMFIVEGDCNTVGIIPDSADIRSCNLLKNCECISREQLNDILHYRNPYTFKNKKANSYFCLNLEIKMKERLYA